MSVLEDPDTGYELEDYAFFLADRELWQELYERQRTLIEEARKKHMGSFYGKPPVPTASELKEKLAKKLARKKKLAEIKAPKIIIDEEDRQITEIYFKLANKKYAIPKDKLLIRYRKQYFEREEEFRTSPKTKALLREIYEYNLSKWEKVKQTLHD